MPVLDPTHADARLWSLMDLNAYDWRIWETGWDGKYKHRGTAATARAHVWWALRQPTGGITMSYPDISRMTRPKGQRADGGRCHTTVMYAIRRYEQMLVDTGTAVR